MVAGNRSLIKAYGAAKTEDKIQRSTVLVDKEGKVAAVWNPVSVGWVGWLVGVDGVGLGWGGVGGGWGMGVTVVVYRRWRCAVAE